MFAMDRGVLYLCYIILTMIFYLPKFVIDIFFEYLW